MSYWFTSKLKPHIEGRSVSLYMGDYFKFEGLAADPSSKTKLLILSIENKYQEFISTYM
jgi:hypothetical protein